MWKLSRGWRGEDRRVPARGLPEKGAWETSLGVFYFFNFQYCSEVALMSTPFSFLKLRPLGGQF